MHVSSLAFFLGSCVFNNDNDLLIKRPYPSPVTLKIFSCKVCGTTFLIMRSNDFLAPTNGLQGAVAQYAANQTIPERTPYLSNKCTAYITPLQAQQLYNVHSEGRSNGKASCLLATGVTTGTRTTLCWKETHEELEFSVPIRSVWGRGPACSLWFCISIKWMP